MSYIRQYTCTCGWTNALTDKSAHMCDRCKKLLQFPPEYFALEQKIADEKAAREKAEAEARYQDAHRQQAEERTEIAESKLKELSEQEPVAWMALIDGVAMQTAIKKPTDWINPHGAELEVLPLYAAPIPSQEIAELQKRIAEIMQAISDPENQPSQYGTFTLEYLEKVVNERIAERKAKC